MEETTPETVYVEDLIQSDNNLTLKQVWMKVTERIGSTKNFKDVSAGKKSAVYQDQDGNQAYALDAECIQVTTKENFHEYDIYASFVAATDGWASTESRNTETETELRKLIENLYTPEA